MRLALPLAAVALAAAALPAHASDVTVTFSLSAGTWAPTGVACPVSVPEGSDGLTVLAVAQAKGCIASYETVSYDGYGTFVTCIDLVCGNATAGVAGTYWNMYENGASTGYGVDAFTAEDGDDLGFAYRPFCFVGAVSC